MKHTVTISQVLHPETGKVLALAITANDGQMYFASDDMMLMRGLLCGRYPRIFVEGKGYVQPEYVEIARLE
jgi:hypothetical protein